MRTPTLAGAAMILAAACTPDPGSPGPAAGEACDEQGACAPGLDCVHLVCADDSGPEVLVTLPEHLMAWDEGPSKLILAAYGVDYGEGDQIEISLDPGLGGPPPQRVSPVADGSATVEIDLPAPLPVGPHHVRARLVDADGQPYKNPSAMHEVVVFVRDPDYPFAPQVALAWPPSAYQHRRGNALEVQIAVLPGTFELADDGDICRPQDDCSPVWAPECEASCGPVAFEGHAKIYLGAEFPDCLLVPPALCYAEYFAVLRPGDDEVEVVDDNQLRSSLYPEAIDELGPLMLHVALSDHYHELFPTLADAVLESVPIEIVE